ncbi:protein THEMIS2 [Latimeria chalumnae]|uniref:protein THEMIS2 n=1 Tax=Latimeria chalumnae TaxID=7897 RepID=UPI00313A9C17
MAGSDPSETLPLQEYIASLLPSSLPRIIQICSGVYFQGSVYEISGNECCLSTGDLVKVISTELQKVTCEKLGETFEIPLYYSGFFRIVPDGFLCSSISEVAEFVSQDADYSSGPFCFASSADFNKERLMIRKGEPLALLSVEVHDENKHIQCLVHRGEQRIQVQLPFSCKGNFYQLYSLQDILGASDLRCTKVMFADGSEDSLVLTPLYEIQAIMQLRKEVVKIPSNLEVDVVDVTELCGDVLFIKPLSLAEVLNLPTESFPTMAEILEGPDKQNLFKSDWFHSLRKGQKLLIHGKHHSKKILAATSRSKKSIRYFLISANYQGKFKKRPQDLVTVYDLHALFRQSKQKLQVVVTRDCECLEEEFPSLSVGDRLEVTGLSEAEVSSQGGQQRMEVLVCNRIAEEDEEEEEIMLPMYLEGRFVEEIRDTKKYSIGNILEECNLPLEMKVVVKDATLANDVLSSFSSLKLEEMVEESFVVASFPEDPSHCFELPAKWINMSLCFIEDLSAEFRESERVCGVDELSDSYYYGLRKLFTSHQPPPPRPPKSKKLSNAQTLPAKPQQLKPQCSKLDSNPKQVTFPERLFS